MRIRRKFPSALRTGRGAGRESATGRDSGTHGYRTCCGTRTRATMRNASATCRGCNPTWGTATSPSCAPDTSTCAASLPPTLSRFLKASDFYNTKSARSLEYSGNFAQNYGDNPTPTIRQQPAIPQPGNRPTGKLCQPTPTFPRTMPVKYPNAQSEENTIMKL